MDTAESRTDLMSHLLAPVAHQEDARATARALSDYSPGQVTVLHVVEKGEGVPDKTPVEQSEQIAADAFADFRSVFPDVDEEISYGRDIVDAILETADEVGASAIAFRSRGGNRLMHFLSGDPSLKLITTADRPVIALPRVTPTNE
jgi:nucleotide-binding universal stress UspA family protein